MNNFRHAEDVVQISIDLEHPTTAFEARQRPEYLTEYEEKRPPKHKIWEIKLNKYLYREDITQENKKYVCASDWTVKSITKVNN